MLGVNVTVKQMVFLGTGLCAVVAMAALWVLRPNDENKSAKADAIIPQQCEELLTGSLQTTVGGIKCLFLPSQNIDRPIEGVTAVVGLRHMPLHFSRTDDSLGTLITLPEDITRVSGVHSIIVERDSQEPLILDVHFKPGQPAHGTEPMVGAKTIRAGQTDETMIVAVPQDRFGNPLADQKILQAKVEAKRGLRSGLKSNIDLSVNNMVAFSWVKSSPEPGHLAVRLAQATNQDEIRLGPSAMVTEFAAKPTKAKISIVDGLSSIQEAALRIENVRDPLGNLVDDGTFLRLDVEDDEGSKMLVNLVTQRGGAEAFLPRALPQSNLRLSLWYGDHMIAQRYHRSSNGKTIIAHRVPPKLEILPQAHFQTVRLGPLVDDLGAFFEDGSKLDLTVVSATGKEHLFDAEVENGWVNLELPQASLDDSIVGVSAYWQRHLLFTNRQDPNQQSPPIAQNRPLDFANKSLSPTPLRMGQERISRWIKK